MGNKGLWLSLTILSLAYVVFGWNLASRYVSQTEWLLLLGCVIVLDWLVTSSSSGFLRGWQIPGLDSNFGALFLIVMSAYLVSILLYWIHLVSDALILVSASMLVTFDLQISQFNRGKSFLILLGFSLLGIMIGGWFHLGLIQKFSPHEIWHLIIT